MRLLLRAGLILGLATAACKDAVGPKSLADPQETTAQMQALDEVFNVAPLTSFSAMSADIAPVAPARVAALRAIAVAANPLSNSSDFRGYARSVENSRMLSRLVPELSGASAAGLFPIDVVGKTFVWNVTIDRYEASTTRTDAPSTGVRFVLYAIDPLTDRPVEPTVEVGYVDLVDESFGTTAKLHVTVAGLGGSPVYVDYTVAIESLSATSGRISVAGQITNGVDVAKFSGTITVSGTQASASITQDQKLDVDSRDIHVRLWEKVTLTQTTVSLRVYFGFKHGAEFVTLEGKFELDAVGETASGEVTVKVDGGKFATCSVDASATSFTQTCQGADADGLNAAEQEALHRLGDGIEHISTIMTGILGPPLNVLGAGF